MVRDFRHRKLQRANSRAEIMSNVSRQPIGPITPRAIVNFDSQGGQALQSGVGNPINCQKFASGALVANTLAAQINVTGGGVINFLRAYVNDSTTRTLRCRLTLDGVVVFDATSAPCGTANSGMQIVGGLAISGSWSAEMDQIPFSKSFKFEVASSLSETGTIETVMQYRTN